MINISTCKVFAYQIFAFLVISLFLACASMKSPEGGPRDTKPPKVLKMEPNNLSVNFKTNKVIIEFDEYIKLQNEFKEFSISPEQERAPILKAKLKKLEITLQDTLEKNTTYTLNFGKAITDINENNELKNFTYVFATGPKLDSLSISGNVKNTLTGKPELEALVYIVPISRDTILGKKKPSIYTLTDSSGNYKLNNLKKENYFIYALKEQSGDKIYQQATDEIGFLKDTLKLDKNLDSVNLKVFKELPVEFRVLDKKLNSDGSLSIAFNKKLKKPEIAIFDPPAYDAGKTVRFNQNNDSLKLWLNKMDFDSIKVAINDEGKAIDTVKFSRGKKDSYTSEIKAGDNLEGTSLNPTKPLLITFNFPVNSIDLTKVKLLEDSIPRTGFTITKDSTDALAYQVIYKWKEKNDYVLVLEPGAINGVLGSKNKEIKKGFTLGSKADYGTLILDVEIPDTSIQYLLEVVDEKKERLISSQVIKKSGKINFSNYKSGIYYVRIVYDENKNGLWDTGSVKEKRQPEKIWYSTTELSIRANWDRSETLKIPLLTK